MILPATQEASDSLRTLNKTPGSCSEKIENRAPAEIVPINGPIVWRLGSSRCRRKRCDPLVLITSKPARSSATMTTRPESAGSALMRSRHRAPFH